MLKAKSFDIVVSDVKMPNGTGIDLLGYVSKMNDPKPPVVLMTGFADYTKEELLDMGASALVLKPEELINLMDIVSASLSDML